MSLKNISLPVIVLEGLYKNSLVATEKVTEEPKAATLPAPGYKFLGANAKKIVLLLNSPTAIFLPDPELLFITQILKACKMDIGDVAIINQSTIPVDIAELQPQFHPRVIILFGLEPTVIKLPFNIPQFKIQAFDDCKYLFTPSLEILMQPTEEGKLLKSKLWVCLQHLFGI